jgi:hypothetical protein
MEFEHRHHQEVHGIVHEHLEELFDEPFLDPDSGHFYVGYGSTVLEISVEPYGPKETIVSVTAYCVQDVDLAEDLLLGLLELNHELPVGSFSLVGSDVFFSHSLYGRAIDRSNLLGTIAAVANVSDDYDDKIVARYGGQTALERIRHTGGPSQRRAGSSQIN